MPESPPAGSASEVVPEIGNPLLAARNERDVPGAAASHTHSGSTSDSESGKGTVENTLAAAAVAVGTFGVVACWLDRITYGKRLKIVALLGASVWVTGHYFPDLYVPAVFLCTLVTYLLLLARLWWIRSDDGDWSWDSFKARVGAVVTDTIATLTDRDEFSWASLLPKLISASVALGILAIALAPAFAALVTESLGWNEGLQAELIQLVSGIERFGTWLLIASFGFWLLEQIRRSRPSAKTAAFKEGARAFALQTEFPPVLDVWEVAQTRMDLPPELMSFVDVLAQWRPKTQRNEDGYERSLKRHLQKALPGSLVENQKPIDTGDPRPGELDVVVDDSIVIELKKDLGTATERDRAIGQVARYSSAWTKGPVLLLICETTAAFSSSPIVSRVEDLRRAGRSVFIAAAGRRLSD